MRALQRTAFLLSAEVAEVRAWQHQREQRWCAGGSWAMRLTLRSVITVSGPGSAEASLHAQA